jgi:hypothetical protein
VNIALVWARMRIFMFACMLAREQRWQLH